MQDGAKLLELRDHERNTPLHLACYARSFCDKGPIVQLLLEKGANPNAKNAWMATPLHIAVATKHAPAAQALIHCPYIDLNCLDERSYTALHEAVRLRSFPFMKLLLSAPGLLPDTPTCDGATPLHFAATWGLYEEAALLLADNRVNPHAQQSAGDYIGATPLHFAAMQAQPEMTLLLLQHGANVGAAILEGAFKGFTPLHFAVMNPDVSRVTKTVDILLRAGAPPEAQSAIGHKKPIDLTNVPSVQNQLRSKPRDLYEKPSR